MKRKAHRVPGLGRRKFLFAASALTLTRAAYSQPRNKTHRIAVVLTTSPIGELLGPEPLHPALRQFIHELRRLGHAEGGNLVLERRSAEGNFQRYPEIIAELLRLKPDLLVTLGGPMALVAKELTQSVPILTIGVEDPVASGVVASLARPGANVTGISPTAGPEIFAKRLELLKEAVPSVTRVAYLGLKSEWETGNGKAARAAAQKLGIAIVFAEAQPTDYSPGFAAIKRERPDAVFVGGTFSEWANRKAIVDALAAMKLPNAHGYGVSAEIGALMSYASSGDIWVRAAHYADKILKGAKPGDLPIEQPTRFELVVNLKAAKAMGIAFPQSFLLRADRVIE